MAALARRPTPLSQLSHITPALRTTGSLGPKVSRRWLSIQELDERKGDRERVIILGSGWAGFGLARSLNTDYYQPVVVSPRTYFVFTPLLASTAVGTLEFRTAMESTRSLKGVEVVRGWADDVDITGKRVRVEGLFEVPPADRKEPSEDLVLAPDMKHRFFINYDKLVVAVGSFSQTFNTPGVREHAMFLKDVTDARKIRRRILERFEEAALPTVPIERKKELLHFAVVGGGPTGIEFSAELHDLLVEDMVKAYPKLVPLARITVFDVAQNILGMFDKKLQGYARSRFERQGIEIMTSHHVERVEADAIITKEEGRIPTGLVVWSTGLAPNTLVTGALTKEFKAGQATLKPAHHPRTKSLLVDNRLRVLSESGEEGKPPSPIKDVFALGDCSAVEGQKLPATAQVANQEAIWLAKTLNSAAKEKLYKTPIFPGEDRSVDVSGQKPFTFQSLGIMAYLGGWTAITQLSRMDVKGYLAWMLWRTAYLSKSVSWRNRILLPVYWFTNWLLGRDINRF